MNNKFIESSSAYEVSDTCWGEVIGKCKSGIFLELDNKQYAFAYSYTYLAAGSKVLCSVKRKAYADKAMLVTIDSVNGDLLCVA